MASSFYPSANMGLPVPSVGIDAGPDYAANINAALTLVDSHDHSAGKGVQITPAGLNINSDLTMASNNLTNARSLRLSIQSAALALVTDLNCLYDVSGDLYFNDGSGNQVRITQGGGVAGSPGSIANLTSPASASYVSANSTFVWQSAANTSANMDGASVLLRNLTASSKALTLSPPAAMAADFTILLPSLPGSTSFVSIDASGNMGATIATSLGINTANIANGAVTLAKQAAVNYGTSGATSVSGLTSTTLATTGVSVTITANGRPVDIYLNPTGNSSNNGRATITGSSVALLFASLVIDDGSHTPQRLTIQEGGTALTSYAVPVSAFRWTDFNLVSGSRTFTLKYLVVAGNTLAIEQFELIAVER